MLSIVLFHFIYHSTSKEIIDISYRPIGTRGQISIFSLPFLYFGVSNFLLISGYYRIKFKISNLLNLLVQCIFYSSLIYIVSSIFINKDFTVKELLYSFMPLTHSPGLWFIPVYICLFLISPLLNTAIEHLSKINYISILLC